ncbi:MAG: hypothetical protein JOZ19_12865 [Rubrobacter sp.]|nr:hypothetical protein [Rubrobacter sp.]
MFILPLCWFAYKRSLLGVVIILLLFPTSLFWFSEPENPSPRVEGYLAWELQFLTDDSAAVRFVLVVLVIGFFVALAAFCRRNGL